MSPRKSVLRWLSLLVLVSLLLAACAPTAPATQPATEAPAAETEAPPAEKKVVTFIWTQEFDTLNPLYTNMWFVSVLYPVYLCQAWWFDDQNSPIPNLVTEIPSVENGGISEDGRTITLKLRDDIVWSDGTPITSADFKFTYDMVMADGNAVASRSPYDLVETLETPDERTVVVTFTEPYAPWLAQLFGGLKRHQHRPGPYPAAGLRCRRHASTPPNGTKRRPWAAARSSSKNGNRAALPASWPMRTSGWAAPSWTSSSSALCRMTPRRSLPW